MASSIYTTISWESIKGSGGYSTTFMVTSTSEVSSTKSPTKWKTNSSKTSRKTCSKPSIETSKKCTIPTNTNPVKKNPKSNSIWADNKLLKNDPKTYFTNSSKQKSSSILQSKDLRRIKTSHLLSFYPTVTKLKIPNKTCSKIPIPKKTIFHYWPKSWGFSFLQNKRNVINKEWERIITFNSRNCKTLYCQMLSSICSWRISKPPNALNCIKSISFPRVDTDSMRNLYHSKST